ncbi:MAG: hypothetical protein A4E30_01691 [Methanomassiliicoccales archaeon PtaB.Bin215]|nr:MAG: hypothetical protein A4E30_01691 [Methanomassiliicoccales archaeon PtaB.Bin215]
MTGRPATMSLRYLVSGTTLTSFCSLAAPFFSFRYSLMKSQPSRPSFLTCFSSLGAFKHRPSAMTRHTPPLTELVLMRGRLR